MATIAEFIGSQVRFSPRRPAVNPSVARRTWSAVTVPSGVTARGLRWAFPGRIAPTGVPSYTSTPKSRTTRASPRTSFAGWMRAPYRDQEPPRVPATWTRSVASLALNSSTRPSPYARSPSTNARSRSNCGLLRATSSTPPRTMSASTPSATVTSTTSPTASSITRCIAAARCCPYRLANAPRPAKPLYSHPPLRPEAPYPQNRRSRTAIRSEGSAFFR